jgi:ABC-2 type transport system permease protein
MKNKLVSSGALRRFGFKQSLKGAIIVGLIAGFMALLQGVAYPATFPDTKSRAQLAASLESAPALGILYGPIKDLDSPVGYMVYRVPTFLALIASIWGLATVTRLLRGQEEDGRWELVLAGNTSARHASWNIFLGFTGALIISFVLTTLLAQAAGLSKDVDISFGTSSLLALMILLPGLLFGAVGTFVSQLSVSRRKVFMYGIVLAIVCFILRGLGNAISDLSWLKHITPFGWAELTSPVSHTEVGWIALLVAVSLFFVGLGIYLAGKRDIGEGFIRESTTVRPKYALLGSSTALAFRQNLPQLIGWAIAAIGISSVMVAITNVAVDATKDTPELASAVAQLGGSGNLKVAFLGTGMLLTATILLIMATAGVASIRSSEAKNYLDTILTAPIRRSTWLINRLLLVVSTVVAVSIISALFTYAIAKTQDIPLELGNFLLVSIALTGTSIFLIGVGTFLYGFLPRIASAFMYAVIAWSFIIDMIGSAVKLDDWLANSSLLHYISQSPSKTPDWSTFIWLVSLGVVFAAIGIIRFTKRDIISE